MDDDPNDVPEFTNFFSKRAKFVPKLSSEELQATSKLLEQIQQKRKKVPLTEVIESVPAKKRGRTKVSAKVNNVKPDNNMKPDNSTIDDISESSEVSSSPLSAATKRRLKKYQRELQSVQRANDKVLSSLNTVISQTNTSDKNEMENGVIDIFNEERMLTILYLSEFSRVKYSENEKFSTIFKRVADLLKLNASEFLLCFKDRNITVEDTPKSLNIDDSDVLECIPFKAQTKEITVYDDNKIRVWFQASDIKARTEMFVHMLEKMQNVMKRYSEIRNIPLEQMVFEFDGEQISGAETPQEMDIESENCIDVRILNADDKLSRKGSNKRTHDIIDLTEDDNSPSSDIIFCY